MTSRDSVRSLSLISRHFPCRAFHIPPLCGWAGTAVELRSTGQPSAAVPTCSVPTLFMPEPSVALIWRQRAALEFLWGKLTMTIFDPARGRIIDGGGGGGNLLRLIGLGIVAFLLVILLFSSVTRVGTGHVGVLTLFGKVQTDGTLGEGIHLISPLKTNNELSIQTQTLKESASVPSSEGLMMSLDTSLIYHLNPDRAAEVFQKIGADYENVVVEPTLRSAIRESTASHTANALYTGEREMVAKQIYDQGELATQGARPDGGERVAARYSVAGDAEGRD